VQDALEELDTEKAASSHTHSTGDITSLLEYLQDQVAALLGAGANISLSYDDTGGTLTIAVTGLDSGDVSDFSEAAQDAVGSILTDSSTIDFTYDDTAGTITAVVKNSSITTGMLAFDVATQAELDAHVVASDPHGDRAYADGLFAAHDALVT
jgi:hypothetical protein